MDEEEGAAGCVPACGCEGVSGDISRWDGGEEEKGDDDDDDGEGRGEGEEEVVVVVMVVEYMTNTFKEANRN